MYNYNSGICTLIHIDVTFPGSINGLFDTLDDWRYLPFWREQTLFLNIYFWLLLMLMIYTATGSISNTLSVLSITSYIKESKLLILDSIRLDKNVEYTEYKM